MEATPQGVPPRAQLLAALRRHADVDARVDARVCCGQWRCCALARKALPTALLLLRRRSSRASQGTLLWLPWCAGSGGAATRAVLHAFLSWRELTAPTGARDCRSLVTAHGFYSLTTSLNGTCTAKRTRCRAPLSVAGRHAHLTAVARRAVCRAASRASQGWPSWRACRVARSAAAGEGGAGVLKLEGVSGSPAPDKSLSVAAGRACWTTRHLV